MHATTYFSRANFAISSYSSFFCMLLFFCDGTKQKINASFQLGSCKETVPFEVPSELVNVVTRDSKIELDRFGHFCDHYCCRD